MRHGDGVALHGIVPVAHPLLHFRVGFAAFRRHRPLRRQPLRIEHGVGGLHLGQRRTFPDAVADLAQAIVERVVFRRKFQGAAHQFHRGPRPAKRTCDEGQRATVAAIARQQLGEDITGMHSLPAAEIVQRNVLRALQPAFSVPRRLAMADVVDHGRRHRTIGLFLR